MITIPADVAPIRPADAPSPLTVVALVAVAAIALIVAWRIRRGRR